MLAEVWRLRYKFTNQETKRPLLKCRNSHGKVQTCIPQVLYLGTHSLASHTYKIVDIWAFGPKAAFSSNIDNFLSMFSHKCLSTLPPVRKYMLPLRISVFGSPMSKLMPTIDCVVFLYFHVDIPDCYL